MRAGQYINVQSTVRDIDEDFLINKVVMKMWNNDQFVYDVSLISTQTFGVIEFLQKLLMDENAKIEINKDENVDVIETIYENLSMLETVAAADVGVVCATLDMVQTTTAYYHTPPFKWAPYAKKSFRFRWDLSEWGT